jgi:TM2 domain-containing membrane protein YozV
MMKNSLRGALWSGFIFPGAGQIVLRRYKRGIALVLTASAIVSVIVGEAVQQAFGILEKIEAEGGAINMNTVTNAAAQAVTPSQGFIFKLLLLLLILCWVIGIVDGYGIGRKRDVEEGRTKGNGSRV